MNKYNKYIKSKILNEEIGTAIAGTTLALNAVNLAAMSPDIFHSISKTVSDIGTNLKVSIGGCKIHRDPDKLINCKRQKMMQAINVLRREKYKCIKSSRKDACMEKVDIKIAKIEESMNSLNNV